MTHTCFAYLNRTKLEPVHGTIEPTEGDYSEILLAYDPKTGRIHPVHADNSNKELKEEPKTIT